MNGHGWRRFSAAALVAVGFGLLVGSSTAQHDRSFRASSLEGAPGGTDINLITGTETHPKVTQDGSAVWGHGSTVVVVYNDSRSSPANYSGASVSTNGGATFTRLTPSPFTGLGDNYGQAGSRLKGVLPKSYSWGRPESPFLAHFAKYVARGESYSA